MAVGRSWSRAAGICCLLLLAPAGLRAEARFITVDQGAGELEADRILSGRLDELVSAPSELPYGLVIRDIVSDNRAEGIVARVTPYAFVVAEMLGAKMDLIATFRSRATGSTTYRASLVVRRSDFPGEPTPTQVLEHIQVRSAEGQSLRFVYHDKFSTSSYFFPSLYFRAQRIFASGQDTAEGISTIDVLRLERGSSSELVKAVASGKADVASVWDGTRAKFLTTADPANRQAGSKVWFVHFSPNLPCDLLVATRNVKLATKQEIRRKLDGQAAIAPRGSASVNWDVQSWVPWADRDAEDARIALSELRRRAAASTLPVVVEVRSSGGPGVEADELEAVRQAIRLAGTEFVGKGEYSDYYKQIDVAWEVQRIHDGALRMTIRYDRFFDAQDKEITQQFDVSYLSQADLTRRVTALIHSRMHRIRPVWLYRDSDPTVIRDLAFDIPNGERLPFQRILWKDPERNDYTLRESKLTQLKRSDWSTLELERAAFPERPEDKTLAFEPMGRQAYRVLLLRPAHERPLFQFLTVSFVVLFALAAAGVAWDARRFYVRTLPHTAPAPAAASTREGSSETAWPAYEAPVSQR